MRSDEIITKMTKPTTSPIEFPPDTIDLQADLVPAIRCLLKRGLTDEFQRSCVRVGGYQAYGGGMKASIVGALRIHVDAVLKLGGADLILHERLMNAVNAHYGPTFPIILDRVEIDSSRQFLIMEDLGRHKTLLDLIYHDGLPTPAMERIVKKTIDALLGIRRVGTRHRSGCVLTLWSCCLPL